MVTFVIDKEGWPLMPTFKVKVLRRENGWREVTEAEFYKRSA